MTVFVLVAAGMFIFGGISQLVEATGIRFRYSSKAPNSEHAMAAFIRFALAAWGIWTVTQ